VNYAYTFGAYSTNCGTQTSTERETCLAAFSMGCTCSNQRAVKSKTQAGPSCDDEAGQDGITVKGTTVYISSGRQIKNIDQSNTNNWCDGNGFIMSQEIIVQNAGTESNFGNYGGLYAYNKPVKGKGSSTFKGVTIEKDSGGSNIFDNQWIYSVSYTSGSSTSERTKNGGRIKQYFLSITADGLVQDSGVWGGCDTNPFADAY
jgi:hypothetical protein